MTASGTNPKTGSGPAVRLTTGWARAALFAALLAAALTVLPPSAVAATPTGAVGLGARAFANAPCQWADGTGSSVCQETVGTHMTVRFDALDVQQGSQEIEVIQHRSDGQSVGGAWLPNVNIAGYRSSGPSVLESGGIHKTVLGRYCYIKKGKYQQFARTSTVVREKQGREITFGVRLKHDSACKITSGCNPDPIYWECFFSESSPWYNGAVSAISFSNRSGQVSDPASDFHTTIERAYHGLVSTDDSAANTVHIHTRDHRYYVLSRSNPVEGCSGCGSAGGCVSPWQPGHTITCNWWHTDNYIAWSAEWVIESPAAANIDVYDEDKQGLKTPANDPIGNPDWDICLNQVPGTPCGCTGPVVIESREPDIDYICANCDMALTAAPTCQLLRWRVISGKDVVEQPHELLGDAFELNIKDIPGRDPDSPLYTPITVRLEDARDPQRYDEVAVDFWVRPDDQDRVPAECDFCPSPKEAEMLARHPQSGPLVALAINRCLTDAADLFGWANNPCSLDDRMGNAYLHACLVCQTARMPKLGPDFAREYWQIHEEYTQNSCRHAAMDFSNDDIGLELASQTGSCRDLVLEALASDRLRWIDETTPDCRWESGAAGHPCRPQP